MKTQLQNQDWRKGPARSLLKMIKDSFQLMDAYISGDDKGEVIHDGQSTDVHIQGPPTYHDVLQTYESTDGMFRHLDSLRIPREEFDKLFNQYEAMRLRCEEVHITERR